MAEFEQFMDSAREVASGKVLEKGRLGKIQHMDEQIKNLKTRLTPLGDYFQFATYRTWKSDVIPENTVEQIILDIQLLISNLDKLEQLQSLKPTNVTEHRVQEKDILACEEKIIEVYGKLNESFNQYSGHQPDKSNAESSRTVQAVELQISQTSDKEEPALDPSQLPAEAAAIPPEMGMQGCEEQDVTTSKETGWIESAEFESSATIGVPVDSLQEELETPIVVESENDSEQKILQNSYIEGIAAAMQPERVELSSVSESEANECLLTAVSERKYPRAYWIAQALEQLQKVPIIPSWLLAAVQGADWFLASWPDQSKEFLASMREAVQPKSRAISEKYSALALSVALGLSYADTDAGWEDWLYTQFPHADNLNRLIEKVSEFIQNGNKLEPLIVQRILSEEMAEESIKQVSLRAKEWLTQAPLRMARFRGATQVWQDIVAPPRGTLYQWYQKVANDQRDHLNDVKKNLENWNDPDWCERHIQKHYQGERGHTRAIEGEARNQIIRWIKEANDIAEQWTTAITVSKPDSGKQWMWDQTADLCESLKELLPKALTETLDLQKKSTQRLEQVGFASLTRALLLLKEKLTILPKGGDRLPILSRVNMSLSLAENIAKSLEYYPELKLNNQKLPSQPLGEYELALVCSVEHTGESAVDGWIARHNYRFINDLLDNIGKNRDEVEEKARDSLRQDIQRLEMLESDKTVVSIEQALADGLVAEQEYVSDKSSVESIRKETKTMDLTYPEDLDLQVFYNRLRQIRNKLEARRMERLDNFRTHWEQLQKDLPRIANHDKSMMETITHAVENNLRQGDLRSVGEAIAHLNDVATGSKPQVSRDLFLRESESYKVKEFSKRLIPMIQLLDHYPLSRLGANLNEKGKFPSLPMPQLPQERLNEVSEAFDAWQKLKRDESKNARDANFSNVAKIMRYLGFTLPGSAPISIMSSDLPGNFQHWKIIAMPKIPAPVPQYGSERAKQLGKHAMYDVIGAWERPGFDSIEALSRQVGNQNIILFYFGRMHPSQRGRLLELTKKKSLSVVVVDELLMLFLAGEYEVRLSGMFECALPYAYVNPYVPFAAGSVPPEMFFGRQDLIDKLKDPYGPAIVYGGRQLGKSALLRQVQRSFHDPEQGRFAIYEDIRLIGEITTGQDYKRTLEDRLQKALTQEKIIEKTKKNLDIDEITDILIHQIKNNGWRILLLLDEADKFLEADAQRNFHLVSQLKRVMDQTDRAFKVVLAGLHHVQQFQRMNNQPLAHLGDSGSIEIGPLEPAAAMELLEKPMRILGYIFGKPGEEDSSLMRHIFSYTNYHPGLLQLFGYYLVEYLRSKPVGSSTPPFAISRTDIEAVYRNQKVREAICDRFNLTVSLDERYEAIALALILEQMDDRNGFDRLFTAEELYKIVNKWWPEGFAEEIYPEKFKGFLDEMRGLGVLSIALLEGTDNKKYRLRSPNLVSLMGTSEQIFNRLDTISQNRPSSHRVLESYHAPINPPYYSPLTYAQESVIKGTSSGVCLVFGTSATQIYSLGDALKTSAQRLGTWDEIRVASKTNLAVQEQLKSFVKQNEKANFLMAYRELDGYPDDMAAQVMAASKFCRQIKNKKLRVVFRLDPLSAWQWYQLPSEKREAIEQDYVDFIVTLNRWDQLGIRQLLEQHEPEIPASEGHIRKIFEVTGGWPNLLDKFIDLCGQSIDPQPALEILRKNLSTDQEKVEFINSLGISDLKPRDFISKLTQEKEQDLTSFSAEEALALIFDPKEVSDALTSLNYLKRLAIITADPYIHIDPIVAKSWHES